jgi:LysM repeat protein
MFLPTVTADAPPTRTITPSPAPTNTPGPCFQEVQAGDSLISLVSRCGHRDLDVIALVLEINNLSAPEVIQVGQTLEIPWPTSTVDPNLEATATVEEVAQANPLIAFAADEGAELIIVPPTATLQPGVAWHQVAPGETIISVAFQYGADVKILSELNPEVTFSQCDFGEFGGGPSCVVNIFEGQQLRVPSPTLTPTLSPTPSGSETPSPSPSPTFNAPSALSPGNRALFRQGELVTLRWVASATLAPGQMYRVTVEDLTANTTYEGDTADLFFIIPDAWQGQDNRRHDYRWSISVIDSDNPDNPYFSTEPRIFVWEGREAE